MVTPLRMRADDFGSEQGLAAQHAVLVGEGEAHDFKLVLLIARSMSVAALGLRGAPQTVALDEAGG